MKTILYFTLTLLTCKILVFVPNSLAQEVEKPIVKVIYFIPKDAKPQPNIDEKLVSQVKKTQKLFGDLMEAHGFERKTFQIEEDANGDVIVHHRRGSRTDAHYRNNVFSLWYEFPKESDLSPLSKLTQLRVLELDNNSINDVSPLTDLVNLERLYLVGNPIQDIEPLQELIQNKRSVKIYVENRREPLPVTLSQFSAEHTDAGLLLSWTTESEITTQAFIFIAVKQRMVNTKS